MTAVVGGLPALAGTGFALGAAGVGLGVLADLATVAVAGLLGAALGALLSGGGGGVHCPGCTGWWR